MASNDNRPEGNRTERLEIRVDKATYKEMLSKADGDRGKLRAILRALGIAWGSGEYPDPPEDLVEQGRRRSPGGGRKKKKKPTKKTKK